MKTAFFFQRALENNIKTGTVGYAWLHHYGMTTQKALKLEKKMNERDSLGNRSLMKMYMALGWWQRKMLKTKKRKLLADARKFELQMFDRTIHVLNHESNKNQWVWL